MELFSGFAWPVPRAFASAVAACRFEQGDVLYDDPVAYSGDLASWGEAVARLAYSLQVLDPARSSRAAPSDAGGRRFDANWDAPVTFELRDLRSDRMTTEQSTQGRLFSCLWRGDPSVLVADGIGEPPSRPRTSRDLHGALEDAMPAIRRARRAAADGAGESLLYAFVADEASESSLSKMRAVVAILHGRLAAPPALLAPNDVLDRDPAFHPALRICACEVADGDEQVVRDLLRSVLYAPTRDSPVSAASEEDRPTSRFRLERHGVLTTGESPSAAC